MSPTRSVSNGWIFHVLPFIYEFYDTYHTEPIGLVGRFRMLLVAIISLGAECVGDMPKLNCIAAKGQKYTEEEKRHWRKYINVKEEGG